MVKSFRILALFTFFSCFYFNANKQAITNFIIPNKKPKVTKVKEITFGIIKPDAVKNKNSGEIIRIIELNNFDIIAMKKIQLTKKQAEGFYFEHKNKSFFKDLINYMTSGPIIVLALEKMNAIKDWRELMGSTNPKKSNPGTLRAMFGTSITENAVHGSDSSKSAQREFKFFF